MKNVSHAKQMGDLHKPSNVSHAKHFGCHRAPMLDSVYEDLAVSVANFKAKGGAYGQA